MQPTWGTPSYGVQSPRHAIMDMAMDGAFKGGPLRLDPSLHSLGVTNHPYPPVAKQAVGRHWQPHGRLARGCASPWAFGVHTRRKACTPKRCRLPRHSALHPLILTVHRHVAGADPDTRCNCGGVA